MIFGHLMFALSRLENGRNVYLCSVTCLKIKKKERNIHCVIKTTFYHPSQDPSDDQSVLENESENVLNNIANITADTHITKHTSRRYPSHA